MPLGSTLGLRKSCIFAPHRCNVQLMLPANQVHLTADGDSQQGSRSAGNAQLASPPRSYRIYPKISYIGYWIVFGHSTTAV